MKNKSTTRLQALKPKLEGTYGVFFMYLVAEGSKIAGEKSTKALSLVLSLAGIKAGRGGSEEVAVAVASAVATTVESSLDKATAAAEEQTRTAANLAATNDPGVGVSGLITSISHSAAASCSSTKNSSVAAKEPNNDDSECLGNVAEEEEFNGELLSDFLSVMDDGVYLNVSTADSPGQVRLRIVTLSEDTFRLLWTNLRDLRKANNTASSLHLCTVAAIDAPRELCVSLSTPRCQEAVSFEAQGSEVFDVLHAGLGVLVADARKRGYLQLAPLAASCRRRFLAEAFVRLQKLTQAGFGLASE